MQISNKEKLIRLFTDARMRLSLRKAVKNCVFYSEIEPKEKLIRLFADARMRHILYKGFKDCIFYSELNSFARTSLAPESCWCAQLKADSLICGCADAPYFVQRI